MTEPPDDRIDALLGAVRAPATGACVDDGVLIAYRAGALDEGAARLVEDHLAGCTECRALLLAMPEAAAGELTRWAAAHGPTRRRSRRWWVPLALAASILAAVAVSIGRPRDAVLPGYGTPELHGARTELRAPTASPQADEPTFAPDGTLEVIVRPRGARPVERSALAIAVEGVDGTWAAAPAGEARVLADGVLVFRAVAAELLGPEPGPRRLRVRAYDPREPDDPGLVTTLTVRLERPRSEP